MSEPIERTHVNTEGFLNSEYERTIASELEVKFLSWLKSPKQLNREGINYSICNKVEEEKTDMDLSGVVGDILAVEQFSPDDNEMTLFFEYIPDTHDHPVTIYGKALKGIPTIKVLKEFYKPNYTHTRTRPNVLLHENGFYINCITIEVPEELFDTMDANVADLKEIALSNLKDMINPPPITPNGKRLAKKIR